MTTQPFKFKQFEVEDHLSSMKVGTDAVLLGSWANPPVNGNILDIGTGCGLMALMMTQRTQATIKAIDVHASSISQAKLNFEKSPWHSRLSAVHQSLEEFVASTSDKFDFVISNPPFFVNSLKPKTERLVLAKHTDSASIDSFISNVVRILRPKGKIALIVPSQLFELIQQKFSVHFFSPARISEVHTRTCAPATRVMAEFVSKPTTCTFEPVNIYGSDKRYTQEYKKLTGEFYLFLNE